MKESDQWVYVVMFRDGEGTAARQRTDTPSIAFLSEPEASAAVGLGAQRIPDPTA